MEEIQFIPTGEGAHGLQVSRDTKSLYVSNRMEGTISVIDFKTRKVIDKWVTGGSPDMFQLSPDGRQLWVSGRYDGAVYVLDTESGELLSTIYTGAQPHGLAYFPNPGRFSLGHNGVYR
jgi:YVTN family beta-propeller protein